MGTVQVQEPAPWNSTTVYGVPPDVIGYWTGVQGMLEVST